MQSHLDNFDYIKNKYPESKIVLCGHSLGGTISILVGACRINEIARMEVINPGTYTLNGKSMKE